LTSTFGLGTTGPGAGDLARAAADLARRVPDALSPLCALAYNYKWSWDREGPGLFASIDPERWARCRHNPVRLLQEASSAALERVSRDAGLIDHARAMVDRLREEFGRPDSVRSAGRGPVGFLCAEYGIHPSLPTYAGGLGVLAGDILKESSDRAMPVVGVGLLYRQGYFHQRLDRTGWQHEFWVEADPERLPAALVTADDRTPVTVTVPLRDREISLQAWRVDVGRVPLFLLDANRPENSSTDRWITARLYVGDRKLRLAQYAILGMGAIRILRALGIQPEVVHLNEGHAALATLEMASPDIENGTAFDDALAGARDRTIFTTHTPVAAGNEAYEPEEIEAVLGGLPQRLGIDVDRFLGLGRAGQDPGEPFGLTPLGLRVSRTAGGVSQRHGRVARAMWRDLYPELQEDAVPIGHVTNGVHLPTWMAPSMQSLLDRYLGERWRESQADPAVWARIDQIPDEELWAVREELRADLIAWVRERAVADRLAREEPTEYVEAAATAFDPGVLTVGFARRVAGYKRLTLLVHDPERAVRLISDPRPIQLLVAGKAHPRDDQAKGMLQSVFGMKWQPSVPERAAFLEDYDMEMAARLVAGCDVWVNVPRPPLEASGTSGMKAALNGALNLSLLDGWWEEAFDGTNGWGIQGDPSLEPELQDDRDAAALYDTLENQVVPLYYDRDGADIPRGWVERIRASLRTIGPRFNAGRMLYEYADRYRLH
jgi:glycogen phosphorylase